MITLLLLADVAGELVSVHPSILLSLIGLLFAALVGATKMLLASTEKRIDLKFQETDAKIKEVSDSVKAVDAHNSKQDLRLADLEVSVREHVAVGITEIRAISAAVDRSEKVLASHVEKEEGETWAKLDGIKDSIADLALQNERAHSSLNERISKAEAKMPNGDLTKALGALASALEKKAPAPRRKR